MEHENDIHVELEGSSSVSAKRGAKRLAVHGKTHPTIQAKQNQMYLITTLHNSPAEVAPINKLPRECLLRIFSFLEVRSLCRCAQVCHQWNQLALDGSNWMRVDLFTFQKDIKTHVIENLARRCGGFLRELSLKGCENIQDTSLRAFTSRCKNIERLSLYKCRRVTDATCENLGRYCHKLVHLNLENCTVITDRACKHIGEGCPNLQYLNISWCDSITNRGVQYILNGCKSLDTLVMKGCEGLDEHCFSGVEHSMGSLTRLNMLNCYVNDVTCKSISMGCVKLEYLCISQCPLVTDRSLISLSQGCKELRDVELCGCTLLSDAGFVQLARQCRLLQRMDLEDCTLISDQTIVALSNNCPQLQELGLSHCELITDDAIATLVTNNKDTLKVLELDNCPLISDAALFQLKNIKNLARIDLYDCQNISKEAINRFKLHRPGVEIHAYFAPATPPVNHVHNRAGLCRCCAIL